MDRHITCVLCAAAAGLAAACGCAASATVAQSPAGSGPGAAPPGAQLWAGRYSGPGNGEDQAFSVAVSPGEARVFVTGTSQGATSHEDYATLAYNAATGARLWVARYNGPANWDDEASALAVSPDGGRVFVTGTSERASSAFSYATVAYNAATGARLWVARYNAPGNRRSSTAFALAVSPDGGRVFVTGNSQRASSRYDYTTVAYNAVTGARLWVARYHGPANTNNYAVSVAVSPRGTRVFVTGRSQRASSRSDYATVAYNAVTGARLWVARYHGPANGFDYASSVAASPRGTRVFVTGTSQRASSRSDYATVAYNAVTGARLWVARYHGPANGNDEAAHVAVSPRGTRVFVTGTSQRASSRSDYATVAYNAATGARLWVARYHGPANGNDYASSVAVSPRGTRVFVTGGSQGARPALAFDYATVAYDAATGARLWVARYNGPANSFDVAISLAVSPAGPGCS